jgi:hypothetical protein
MFVGETETQPLRCTGDGGKQQAKGYWAWTVEMEGVT